MLELLITMTLIALISTFGLASYSYLIRKNEQQTLIDELKTAVHYAKMQSLALGQPVVLTPLENSLDWAHGMKLSNKKGDIYQWQWHHPRWKLNWNGVYSNEKIVFSNNPYQAVSNGRFVMVNLETKQQVSLILNRLGRLRVERSRFATIF